MEKFAGGFPRLECVMRALAAILLAALSTAALPQAAAQGFAGDNGVFSGIAGNDGDGLITDDMIALPAFAAQGVRIHWPSDNGQRGFALLTAKRTPPGQEGLPLYPDTAPPGGSMTVLLADRALWGVTPYVGAGVTAQPLENGLFQGMDRLLPAGDPTTQFEGVAGLSYQFMPGLGAGIEYRFRDGGRSSSVPGAASSENQTIMLRLDLGLN
jgi:hypothetical protein